MIYNVIEYIRIYVETPSTNCYGENIDVVIREVENISPIDLTLDDVAKFENWKRTGRGPTELVEIQPILTREQFLETYT